MKHLFVRNRLFFKIFLWFWLSFLAVNAVFIFVTFLTQPEMYPARMRNILIKAEATAAVSLFERNGDKGVTEYFNQLGDQTGVGPFLFDLSGNEVTGKPAPPEAIAAFHLAKTADDVQAVPDGTRLYSAYRVANRSGQDLVFVGETSRFPDVPLFTASLWYRLGRFSLTALAAGLICLWLSRYLTAPITKISRAARRVADGDLTTRVGPEFEKRRDELSEMSLDFDRMAEKIEGLMQSQQRLLSDISHELRSPLARLNIALDLARNSNDVERRDALNIIERESGRLNEQIKQLLTLSAIENSPSEAKVDRLDLGQLIQEIATEADFEASSRNRRVVIIKNQVCTVLCHARTLRSATENVVRNAVNYTAENTAVEIALSCETSANGRIVKIVVRDHGPGLPEDELGRIFTPFYRVAAGRERKSGGVGLGLAIAESGVRFHAGTIKAENAEDGGLAVIIELFFPG